MEQYVPLTYHAHGILLWYDLGMNASLRGQAIKLRCQGKMYSEIQTILNVTIPKSTLATWCKGIRLNPEQNKRIQEIVLQQLFASRKLSVERGARKRLEFIEKIQSKYENLPTFLPEPNTQRIALAILYAAEGTKNERRGVVTLGNSSKEIIRLYLYLLRQSFSLDEKRFRCTVQCRADQNTEKLQKHWSEITRIPESQFYKPQVDPRSIGKPSKKLDYLGVCRIDYLSASLLKEIMQIVHLIDGKIVELTRAHSSAG